jgi:hypothetical protein
MKSEDFLATMSWQPLSIAKAQSWSITRLGIQQYFPAVTRARLEFFVIYRDRVYKDCRV